MKAGSLIWAALGLAVIAVLVFASLSGRMPEPERGDADAPSESGASRSETASAAALYRCQLMAEPDDTCRQVWAENRRHFLGQDSPSSDGDR